MAVNHTGKACQKQNKHTKMAHKQRTPADIKKNNKREREREKDYDDEYRRVPQKGSPNLRPKHADLSRKHDRTDRRPDH